MNINDKYPFDDMDGRKFERFCAELLRKNGYTKVEITSGSGDFGVDILAEKDSIRYAIQCKRHNASIGNTAVQEIFSGKEFYKCHVGIVLTNNNFTQSAKETAKNTGIVLWDRDWLIERNAGSFDSNIRETVENRFVIKPLHEYEVDYPPSTYDISDFFLGISSNGDVALGNLNNVHHMFVKGSISSGKTNFLHCFIGGVLHIGSLPENTRFILIDTKGLEFRIYSSIPQLLLPVVTDVVKAAGALQWAVVEMTKRYMLFSEIGAQGIEGYNEIVFKLTECEQLPRVIVIIDEIGDILNHYKKEPYDNISSLVQKGNRVGIHVVAATGSSAHIKSLEMLFPSVIDIKKLNGHFIATASIADEGSKELFIPYVEMEYLGFNIDAIVAVYEKGLKDNQAKYSKDVFTEIYRAGVETVTTWDDANQVKDNTIDELLPQSVDLVFETGQASVSVIQRRLKLGYSRAARIIDQMEHMGIVGPFDRAKPRAIAIPLDDAKQRVLLITKAQWQKMQQNESKNNAQNQWPEINESESSYIDSKERNNTGRIKRFFSK